MTPQPIRITAENRNALTFPCWGYCRHKFGHGSWLYCENGFSPELVFTHYLDQPERPTVVPEQYSHSQADGNSKAFWDGELEYFKSLGQPTPQPAPSTGETPRTDAEANSCAIGVKPDDYIRADFARQLERELTALKSPSSEAGEVADRVILLTCDGCGKQAKQAALDRVLRAALKDQKGINQLAEAECQSLRAALSKQTEEVERLKLNDEAMSLSLTNSHRREQQVEEMHKQANERAADLRAQPTAAQAKAKQAADDLFWLQNKVMHAAGPAAAKSACELQMTQNQFAGLHEQVTRLSSLNRELSAKVEQLESERQNWRVSSVCRELAEENGRLAAWKKSAIAVESEWDSQAIAKMLGARLGQSCRKVINEEVPKLARDRERLDWVLAGNPVLIPNGSGHYTSQLHYLFDRAAIDKAMEEGK